MNQIDQILAVKTRLTTIKGYAQMIERELNRPRLDGGRLSRHAAELNQEIDRMIALIAAMEDIATNGEGMVPRLSDVESNQASSRE